MSRKEITDSEFPHTRDAETYFLLRNYLESGMPARRLIYETLFEKLDAINRRISTAGDKEEKDGLMRDRVTIQLEVISKVMMLSEDLVVILEAIRSSDGHYYEVLRSQRDLGAFIGEFMHKVDSFTDDDFRAMLSYVDPSTIENEKHRAVVEKLIKSNIAELKSFLKLLGGFSGPHSRIHKQYKHGGVPIRAKPDTIKSESIDLAKFDSYSIIFTNQDLLTGVTLLPYAEKVITAYNELKSKAEQFLKDAIDNKIACMEREIQGMIPYENYNPVNFTQDELKLIEEVKSSFSKENPPKLESGYFDIHATAYVNDITNWYDRCDDIVKHGSSREEI